MKGKSNANVTKNKGSKVAIPIDASSVVQKIQEALNAVDQYKAENPGVDVDAFLTSQNPMYPMIKQLAGRELNRFVAYAKEQGTALPFDTVEMGVLAAGRKDMQNGLAEILNNIKFDKPACPECDEGMDDQGRSKKKL